MTEAELKSVSELSKLIESGALAINAKKRAENRQVVKEAIRNNEEIAAFNRGMIRKYGQQVDIFQDKHPMTERLFSWRKLKNQCAELAEADSSSTFVQFLRAGIQAVSQAAYENVPMTYEDWVTTVPSSRDTELYAPNHGVSFPREVPRDAAYPEVGAAALDMKLVNRKYGGMYSVEWELLMDDQTGSFQRQASLLGEYVKQVAEVLCYAKLASVANMQYVNLTIPQSETKPSNEASYPWSTSLVGGGRNRPDTYGVLGLTTLTNGIIGLMNQKNLQGIKMLVNPNRLLIGPQMVFDAAVLLNSSYYPSGAQAAGVTGGAFAINPVGPNSPFRTIAQITASRFVFKSDGTVSGDSKAWYLVDDGHPWFVLQLREPVTVEQEAPNSGAAFERDVIRFKARMRGNADFIDPRFAWQGNDGSVTA